MVNSKMKIFSVLAVLALLLCSLIPIVNCGVTDADQTASEDEKKTYKYVSLGDSMSAGYGMSGYEEGKSYGFMTEVKGTYSNLVTEFLKEQLGETYDVEHLPLAIAGLRMTDLRAILDETFVGCDGKPGDDYSVGLFNTPDYGQVYQKAKQMYPEYAELDGIDLLRAIYFEEFAEADMITYHDHLDLIVNLGMPLLGPGIAQTEVTNFDFTLFYDSEFAGAAQQIAASVEKAVIDYFKSRGMAEIEEAMPYIDLLIKGMIYSVTSYCSNFDAIMGYIFENNPDAKVLVVDPYVVVEDLNLVLGDTAIDIADLYETILGIATNYTKYCSPYSLYCYSVSEEEHPYTLMDEFRYLDVESIPAEKLKDAIRDETKADFMSALTSYGTSPLAPTDPMGVIVYDGMDKFGNLSKLGHYVFIQTDADLVKSSSTEIAGAVLMKLGGAVACIEADSKKSVSECTVTYNTEDGSCTVKDASASYVFTKEELALSFVVLMSGQTGLMIHAGPIGNEYIASCIEEEIILDDILSEGNRIYIIGDGSRHTAPGIIEAPAPDFLDTITLCKKAAIRGTINFISVEWPMAYIIVHSEAYTAFYQELVDSYIVWNELYTSGAIDAAVEEVHTELIALDENWEIIFGEYADLPAMIQLRTILQNILYDWDIIQFLIAEYAEAYDTVFKKIVDFFEPESIRALLDDIVFTVTEREHFLNMGLNYGTFFEEIYYDIESSTTAKEALQKIGATILKFVSPCHDAKMFEATERTCTEDGCLEHYVCKLCGSYFILNEFTGKFVEVAEEDVIIHAEGHAYVTHDAVTPTCKHAGNNLYYTCENCDMVFKDDMMTPTTVEAETLPMLEHQHEKIPGVTPTKTKTGLTEGEKCSACGDILVAQKVIPATGTSDVELISTSTNIYFFVEDSDEITSLTIKFNDELVGWYSTIYIPESAMAALKGKYIDFTVVKSSVLEDTYNVVMLVSDPAHPGDLPYSYNDVAYISIPYDQKKGDPAVTWVEGESSMEVTDKSNGMVTFKTTHNSMYQVTYTHVRDMTPVIVSMVFVILVVLAAGLFWRKSGQ